MLVAVIGNTSVTQAIMAAAVSAMALCSATLKPGNIGAYANTT